MKTEAEIRGRLVKKLRMFAIELRMEFGGRAADHASRGIDEIALSVEQRTLLTMSRLDPSTTKP